MKYNNGRYIYIPNDNNHNNQNYLFSTLKLFDENFEHCLFWTNQPGFNKSTQSFKPTNKREDICKLWVPV